MELEIGVRRASMKKRDAISQIESASRIQIRALRQWSDGRRLAKSSRKANEWRSAREYRLTLSTGHAYVRSASQAKSPA